MSGIFDVSEKQNKSSINRPCNGLGTYAYPDGRIYVGEFKEGSFHGRGVYSWPDGRVYVGEFKNGKRNGRWDTKTKFGQTKKWHSGVFKNDVRVSD